MIRHDRKLNKKILSYAIWGSISLPAVIVIASPASASTGACFTQGYTYQANLHLGSHPTPFSPAAIPASKVGGFFSHIIHAVSGIVGSVVHTVSSVVKTVKSAASSVIKAGAQVISHGISSLGNFISQKGQVIFNVLPVVSGSIGSAITKIGTGLGNDIGNAISYVTSDLGGVIAGIGTVGSSLVSGIGSSLGSVIGEGVTALGGVAGSAIGFVDSVIGSTVTVIGNLIPDVAQKITDLFNQNSRIAAAPTIARAPHNLVATSAVHAPTSATPTQISTPNVPLVR